MTIENLSKSLESCLNDADFKVDLDNYCETIEVDCKQFSDIDLVLDNNGIIMHIEGKTIDKFGWFASFPHLSKKSYKYFEEMYRKGVSKGQRRLHYSYSAKNIIVFCSIGENVSKPGYSIEKENNEKVENYNIKIPLQTDKDAHVCYHNSLFMHCLFPDHALKENFINWFSTETVDKTRVGIKYEETWTPEKPESRAVFIYAKGYKDWPSGYEKSPKSNLDNRKTLNNIPAKFLHFIGRVT